MTDDEIRKIDGAMDKLAGAIQEKYGQTKEQAREKLNSFLKISKTLIDDKKIT